MKKILDDPIVPFLFILFYLFHPMVLEAGGLYQTIAIFIFLLYAVVCAIRLHKMNCQKFIYFLDFFIIMQMVYFLLRYPELLSGNARHLSLAVNQIKSVLTVMMPIYIYYFYGMKGKLTKNHLIWFSIIFLVLSIPMFYYTAYSLMEKYSWIDDYNDTTNNKAYYFAQCCIFLPLIANKKVLSAIIISVIVFFLILGVKRGAMLCFVCILPFYMKFFIKGIKWYAIVIVTIGFIFLANWMIDYFSNMDYLFTRIEETQEGNLSSRDRIYGQIIDYFFGVNSSIFSLLFGFGFCASFDMARSVAHNDWLELLSGFGFIGLLLYVLLFFQVILIYKRTQDPAIKLSILIILIMWFIEATFSMAYTFTLFQFLLLGGLCGIALNNSNQDHPFMKFH